jgi:hypothetical protein
VGGICLLLPAVDRLVDRLPHRIQADALRLQRLRPQPLAMDQTEQKVFGADVVVIARPGLVLGLNHDHPRPVGEDLEHAPRRPSRAVEAFDDSLADDPRPVSSGACDRRDGRRG